MLAVAAKVSAPPRATLVRVYPVPGGLGKDEPTITRRAMLWSLVLHLTIALTGIVGMWASQDDRIATPHSIDATIIPLSAFETQIPRGIPQPEQSAHPIPPKPMEKTVQRAAERSAKVVTATKDSSQMMPSNQSPTSLTEVAATRSNSGPVGEPNSSSSEPARLSYQDMVATKLAQAKRYPERALRKNVNGDGAIRIQISSNGDVSHFEIVQSTSSTILDEELKDMVERASPFPPFPPDMRRDTLAVIVPVSFRLDRAL
jgi:protein TonB